MTSCQQQQPTERRDQALRQFAQLEPCLVNPADPQSARDLALFRQLFRQFLAEPHKVDWARIRPMRADDDDQLLLAYERLPEVGNEAERNAILDRLAVVKLNGGLGTTMGCTGPKSLVELRDGLTFMDFALRQHAHLNSRAARPVPLLLMNSFSTDALTKQYLENNQQLGTAVRCFCQSRCPRIFADTLLPVPTAWDDNSEEGWYPPGHGNVLWAMSHSGLLDELLSDGRDVAFFANIDNTGAVVDERIGKVLADGRADYLMEMTPRTKADVKGGTLVEMVDEGGRLMHLECPQVPEHRLDEFCSLSTFKMFNTNNIWVNLRVVKQRLHDFKMEILANEKRLEGGERVIQLEQSIGGAIRNFPGRAAAVCVQRNRFLPVKSTRDLFRVRSPDLFTHCARSCMLHQRVPRLPDVELSAEFARLADFEQRIPQMPRLHAVRSVCLRGDVWLGRGVQMQGTVRVVETSPTTTGIGGRKQQIRISDNSIVGEQQAEVEVEVEAGKQAAD